MVEGFLAAKPQTRPSLSRAALSFARAVLKPLSSDLATKEPVLILTISQYRFRKYNLILGRTYVYSRTQIYSHFNYLCGLCSGEKDYEYYCLTFTS